MKSLKKTVNPSYPILDFVLKLNKPELCSSFLTPFVVITLNYSGVNTYEIQNRKTKYLHQEGSI